MTEKENVPIDLVNILEAVQEKLREKGVHVDMGGNLEECCDEEGAPKVKVVCVPAGLGDSVRQMGKSPRGQVVMVRVDAQTNELVHTWQASEAPIHALAIYVEQPKPAADSPDAAPVEGDARQLQPSGHSTSFSQRMSWGAQ